MAPTRRPSRWIRPSPTIRVGALGMLAAFLVALPLALAPRAEAFIYWTTGSIVRANLDGTGVDRSFITGTGVSSAGDLAVDAGHIYWTHRVYDDETGAFTGMRDWPREARRHARRSGLGPRHRANGELHGRPCGRR